MVNFAGDFGGYTINSHTADPAGGSSNGGRGTHPIIMESWYGNFYHAYPGANPDNPPGAGVFYLMTPIDTASGLPPRVYGCPNPVSGDEIQFLGTSTLDASDFDATYAESGATNLTWVTNSAAAPIISKAVFMSMPMEAINPEYYTVNNTYILKNRRAEIMHNVGDYLRTGSLVGVVRDLNGAVPVKGVFLRALSTHRVNADGSPYVYATTFTLGDGSYTLDGLDTYGAYNLDIFKAGFVTSHGQGGIFHGGYQSTQDFFIAEAKPGSISGTVVLNGTTTPAPGLIVVATDVVSAATFSGTTLANGTYTITNVPASNYSVTIPNSPAGNLNLLGYGSCIPSSYGPPPAPKPEVVVAPSTPTSGINFAVTQAPGSLTGKVTSALSNPTNPGEVIAGATVTATDVNLVTYTGITNGSGVYTIPNLVPGSYGVVATASGYTASASVPVTINTNQATTQNFALLAAKPGGIQGLVSTSLGIPIPGATVTITNAAGNPVLDVHGNPVFTTTAVQTNGNVSFNYDTGLTVPAGAVVNVAAAKTGYNCYPAC